MTPSPSLLGELKTGLSRRAALAVILVGILGTGLHAAWSVHQKRVTQERVREAIAHILREHIRTRDLISIQRTIHAFGLANDGAVICVRLAGGMLIHGPSCENPSFRAFEIPLKGETFDVSVQVPILDRMVMAGIPFVFGLFMVVGLVSRYLRRLSGRISGDLEILGTGPGASANGLVFDELRRAQARIDEGNRLKEQAIIGQVAAQIAHDIRSPVAALKVAIRMVPEVAHDSKELIASAISRISAIAEDLLKLKQSNFSGAPAAPANAAGAAMGGEKAEVASPRLMPELVGNIVREKETQYRETCPQVRIALHIDERACHTSAAIVPSDIQRIVSNLVDNAVEAIEGDGTVTTLVSALRDRVRVEVRDTGRGIPPELLPRLCQEGATFGKEGGNGLGLFHARTTVERIGGAFAIDSVVGYGTQVSIELPMVVPPHFMQRLASESCDSVPMVALACPTGN